MHIHFAISIFVMFMLGNLIHAWQRASESVVSKLNGIGSYSEYIRIRGNEVAGRIFLVSCIFGGWVSGGAYEIIGYFAPKTGEALASHPIPITWWTAGIVGYFGDSILYYMIGIAARFWPDVRKEVPPSGTSIQNPVPTP